MLWMAQREAEETPPLTFFQTRTNMVPVFPHTLLKTMLCCSKPSAGKDLWGDVPSSEVALDPPAPLGVPRADEQSLASPASGAGLATAQSCDTTIQGPGWLPSGGEMGM